MNIEQLQETIKQAVEAQRAEASNGAMIRCDEKGAIIDTRIAQDSGRSRNGGDYHEWTEFTVRDGGVWVSWDWSCEISDYGVEPEFYPVGLTVEQLHQMIADIGQNITDAESVWKSFRMTRGERDSLNRAADRAGVDASEFVRNLLRKTIEDFPQHEHEPGRR